MKFFQSKMLPNGVRILELDLIDHIAYLCEENRPTFYEMYFEKMRTLLLKFRIEHCKTAATPTNAH